MSARDFMPFITGSGGPRIRYAPLTASSTFLEGEMVAVVDAGTLSELTQNDGQITLSEADSALFFGVAAMDGGTTRTDGFARSTGDLISYYPVNDGTLFITKNFVGAGTPDTAAIPADSDVGESYQIAGINANGTWAIEQTAGVMGVDLCALIHNVLNVRKEPLAAGDSTTGIWLVFELQVSVGT
jgi:hypothetical protein